MFAVAVGFSMNNIEPLPKEKFSLKFTFLVVRFAFFDIYIIASLALF